MLDRSVRDETATPGKRAEAAQYHKIAADTLGRRNEQENRHREQVKGID